MPVLRRWGEGLRGASLRRCGFSAAALAAVMSAALPPTACAETLREALASAYLGNPKLDAERAKLRATDEDVARAQSGYQPYVQGSADLGRQNLKSVPASATSGKSDPWGYTLSVKQSVFNGFRTTNEVSEAEAVVKAGRENLRQVETLVLLDAVTAYMDVVRDSAIVRIRERNVEVLSRDLNGAQVRRASKEVTKTDVAQARARRARAVSAADLAKANLKISRAAFEKVVGHAANDLRQPALKMAMLPKSIEDAWQMAERQSPNVNSALYREEAARFAVDKVRGELLPEVAVEASYAHHEDPSAAYDEQQAASVTGRVSIPLYDGGEIRARVRQAKHTHVSRLQEIEQARTETQALVTASWSRVVAGRAQLSSDKEQVEANRIALNGVREEEKVGQRTMLDVLNAEQEYLDAQIQLVSTRRDLVVSNHQLLASIGLLNAESLELGAAGGTPDVRGDDVRSNWFGMSISHADGRREVIEASDPETVDADAVE